MTRLHPFPAFRFSRRACSPRPTALLFLTLILGTLPAKAGTVRTLDGRTYDGEVRFESGQIIVSSKRPPPVRIDLQDVLSADFTNAPPRAATARSAPSAAAASAEINWKTADVGRAGNAPPGTIRASAGKWFALGAGNNIAAQADSFFFAYQECNGDGQLIARLSDLQRAAPGAKVGLMLRESLDRPARNAFVGVIPNESVIFSSRGDPAGSTARVASPESPLPVWLRLARVGNTVTAYRAPEGGPWLPIGRPVELPIGAKAFIGLAVCSHDVDAACTAIFEGVTLTPGTPAADAPSPTLAAPPVAARAPRAGAIGDMLGRSVVLRNGIIFEHATVQSADTKTVRITRADGQSATLDTADVARLILAPVTPQQLARLPAKGTGVLLARGDFMEADFESLQDGRVRMNSIVFGPSNLATAGEAVIVVLHDMLVPAGVVGGVAIGGPGPVAASWSIKTDQLTYAARSARIEGNDVVIEEQADGKVVKVTGAQVTEITSGRGRFDELTSLRPKIDGPAGFATTAGALRAATGASLTYDLGARYRLFTARCGVPDGVLPTLAVRFIVLIDGKEAHRSPARSGLDDSTPLAVDVTGAKTLTLRVETAGNVNLPAAGLWSDALLVK